MDLLEQEEVGLEQEEVGFVQHGSVTNMLQQGFQDALFVTDEQLNDPLELTFVQTTGGLLFHTLRRNPPHLLPLPPPLPLQQQQQQEQQGQGQGAGGGGGPQHQQQQQQQLRRRRRTTTRRSSADARRCG